MNPISIISSEMVLVPGIALFLGLFAGWAFFKFRLLKKMAALENTSQTTLATLTETLRVRTQELSELKVLLEKIRVDNSILNQQITERETRMEELQKSSTEKITLLENMKAQLTDTYTALAAHALEKSNQSFMELADVTFSKYMASAKKDFELSNEAVKNVVLPVKDALNKYDEQMRTMEREREKAYGGLSQQVVSLLNSQTELQKETGKLVKAMRLPHVRGRWGEITLRRTAELSGMVKHCDFFEQPTTVSDNSISRPDMMVCLPGDRKVIIDAKVPIIAYLDALEADTDEKRDKLLMDHAGHVQNHIRQLAQKAYWHQFDPSPEFVVMFIPGENFFSAALAQNPDLIEFGAQRGVIPATPTTLITLLKTISFAWRQEIASENSKIISALGKELYERLNTLAKHVNRLGRDIDRSAQTYNQVLGSFEKRVFSAARKFNDLGVSLKEDKELMMIDPVETKARELFHVETQEEVSGEE
ncbi:MAG: DNA recombination protein RmuC [Desulfobacteraceae bacterium]|nr:DNA recombination protein RmuC [Desulfobacteraceae bacterium]MBU4002755.1 DNA recombination protein RmuC [Pseudomonadota bacterium]MBU4052950.1 DNA recombination protein RmuC [Pseudomonadota bacterium]